MMVVMVMKFCVYVRVMSVLMKVMSRLKMYGMCGRLFVRWFDSENVGMFVVKMMVSIVFVVVVLNVFVCVMYDMRKLNRFC